MVRESETIVAVRVADLSALTIDYRLNILGIRVWEHSCQLIAKTGPGAEWSTIGPRLDLPVHVPQNAEELKAGTAAPDGISIQRRMSGVGSRGGSEKRQGFRICAEE